VAHEAEQAQAGPEPLDTLGEHVQKTLAVGVVTEDRPSPQAVT